MSVKQLILPANRAFNSNGFPVPGATAHLYLSGGLTPANFYDDSDLLTPLGPVLTANGAGRFELPAYQDEFTAFRLITKDASGAQLDDVDPFYFGYQGPQGIQGIGGDLSKVATRLALSQISVGGQPTGITRYLYEPGFQGVFVWYATDLSAFVSVDTSTGLYIPPHSGLGVATDGTDGAWVRQFDGPAQSTWFGVSTSGTASANTTAFNAALTLLKLLAIQVSAGVYYGYNKGSIGLHTPAGHYTFDDTLLPDHQLDISGDYTGSGGGTVFEWTADVHGFEALGGSGHANGATIRNLYLKGTNAGAAKHAVNTTGNLRVETCFFENWSGDGVHADSTAGGLSGSSFRHLTGQNIGWTVSLDGADSNGCTMEEIGAVNCRFGAIRDSSGIGNVCLGGVVNGCGRVTNYHTRCHVGGFIYTVAPDQEAWCSANAPTGAATSNQGWWYVETGTAQTYQPTWSAAQTWYFSAPLYVEATDGNVRGIFVGMYVESGLNPIVMSDPSLVVGGQILTSVLNQFGTRHGGYISADRYYTLFNNGIKTQGNILLPAATGVYVNDIQVIGERSTGWTADTGTAKKTSNVTYTGGSADVAYNQSQVTAIRNGLQDASETVAAIKAALLAHGLIG